MVAFKKWRVSRDRKHHQRNTQISVKKDLIQSAFALEPFHLFIQIAEKKKVLFDVLTLNFLFSFPPWQDQMNENLMTLNLIFSLFPKAPDAFLSSTSCESFSHLMSISSYLILFFWERISWQEESTIGKVIVFETIANLIMSFNQKTDKLFSDSGRRKFQSSWLSWKKYFLVILESWVSKKFLLEIVLKSSWGFCFFYCKFGASSQTFEGFFKFLPRSGGFTNFGRLNWQLKML